MTSLGLLLAISVVFSTAFAAFYKIAARKNCNLESVNIWMYIGSTAATAAYILIFKGHAEYDAYALTLGIVAGVLVFFATLAFFYHMQYGQLSASWTVISLSIAFPVLASMLIWHEKPSIRQIAGMVLIVAALVLFGRHEINSEGKME